MDQPMRPPDAKLSISMQATATLPGGNSDAWADLAQALSDIAYQGSAVIESFNPLFLSRPACLLT